jgi:hypothetical protein
MGNLLTVALAVSISIGKLRNASADPPLATGYSAPAHREIAPYPVWISDATNGDYPQRLIFKSITTAVLTVCRVFLSDTVLSMAH